MKIKFNNTEKTIRLGSLFDGDVFIECDDDRDDDGNPTPYMIIPDEHDGDDTKIMALNLKTMATKKFDVSDIVIPKDVEIIIRSR